jgi:hypothetical protein
MSEATLLDGKPSEAAPAEPAKPAAPAPAEPTKPAASAEPAKPTALEANDWRKGIIEARAKGDDALAAKLTKKLERFADPGAILDSWEAATAELSAQGRVKIPGKDATDEDRATFNKALGVPATADKYDMKGILKAAVPEGMTADDNDKTFLTAAIAQLHEAGGVSASPAAVEAMARVYFDAKETALAQTLANEQTAKIEAEKTLKAEWGADYRANLQFANAGISAYGTPEMVEEILNWRAADGSLLGSNPAFMKLMASAGRHAAQDPLLLVASQIGGSPQSLQERKSAIMAMAYGTPDQQKQYDILAAPGGELEALVTKLAALAV